MPSNSRCSTVRPITGYKAYSTPDYESDKIESPTKLLSPPFCLLVFLPVCQSYCLSPCLSAIEPASQHVFTSSLFSPFSLLYSRKQASVGPSTRPSVRPSVGPSVHQLVGNVFFLSQNSSQKVIKLPSMPLPNVRDYWPACPPCFLKSGRGGGYS